MNRVVSKTATKNAARRLGAHLRGMRTGRAWTQRQVAAEVGVDTVTLRRWELGIFSPSLDNMERVATVLGVDVDSLMRVVSGTGSASGQSEVPIKGYVDAGAARREYDVDLGAVFVPTSMIEEYPSTSSRVVSGDSMIVDGIHDSDILVVSLDGDPRPGRMCIIRLGTAYCGAVYVPEVGYRWRTPSGRTENLPTEEVGFEGNVVCHIRKM